MHPGYTHFNYDITDGSCKCKLCEDVRETRAEVGRTYPLRSGQTYGSPSPENMAWRSAVSRHVAASNRREVYSEICFLLTWENIPWKNRCLDWIFHTTFRDAYAVDYWWVQCGEERPLGIWIEEWWEGTQGTRMSYTRIFDIGTDIIQIVDAEIGPESLPAQRGLFIRCLLPVLLRPDIKVIAPKIRDYVLSVPDRKLARQDIITF